MDAQDDEDVVFRDNASAMKLENDDKTSAGTRARHFENLFYAADLIKMKQASIKHCSTDSMIAGYMMKPLTG
jgi:hypothetical protein